MSEDNGTPAWPTSDRRMRSVLRGTIIASGAGQTARHGLDDTLVMTGTPTACL